MEVLKDIVKQINQQLTGKEINNICSKFNNKILDSFERELERMEKK